MEETPVVDVPKVEDKAPVAEPKSPAADLREIQALLANGIFPGNVAPAVVRAYNLLERMAVKVEADAKQS